MINLETESLDSLTIGYIVTTTDHEVVLINYAARELLAITHQIRTLEQVVKKLPAKIALLDHVKYCSIEHKSCSFREVELGERKVRVFLSPIFDGAVLRGNLLTLEDITDKLNQERARDQFLSFLVHELRTPLTAIRGNSQMAQEYMSAAVRANNLGEILDDITAGSEYVLGMVNQFLDMARLEEGRIEFEVQEFDLTAAVAQCVHELTVLAKAKGLTLEVVGEASQPVLVVADPVRTKQVLTNLVGNALKFTAQGGVTVEIVPSASLVDVRVTDTGAGIPAESISGLFGKYFQAANNELKHDSSKSTGLGLYVTKLVVEGMGGQIRLDHTELGKGSTFLFSLDRSTPDRLKQLEKDRYDHKQGVQHAPAGEHHTIELGR